MPARRGPMLMILVFLLPALSQPACWLTKSMTVPMRSLREAPPKQQAQTAVVLLPGYMDDPEDLAEEGLIAILRDALPAAELITVDAHFAYYRSRTLLTRLEQDIIAPARARGIERFWLLGISMGGVGALLYAKKHSEDIAGLMLIAPFLGDDEVIAEIRQAGGLAHWNPPAEPTEEDYQRSIWTWLKSASKAGPGSMPIYLGWGVDDDFAEANGLLAQALPPDRIVRVPGGHDWEPWRLVLEGFLTSKGFAADADR